MKKWLLVAMTVALLTGCSGKTPEDKLAQYEEYEVLSEKIDISAYEVTIETDNSGNRVLFFSESNDEKVYKSIFVKNNNHLKLSV